MCSTRFRVQVVDDRVEVGDDDALPRTGRARARSHPVVGSRIP
jgi:hypothetical protein